MLSRLKPSMKCIPKSSQVPYSHCSARLSKIVEAIHYAGGVLVFEYGISIRFPDQFKKADQLLGNKHGIYRRSPDNGLALFEQRKTFIKPSLVILHVGQLFSNMDDGPVDIRLTHNQILCILQRKTILTLRTCIDNNHLDSITHTLSPSVIDSCMATGYGGMLGKSRKLLCTSLHGFTPCQLSISG